MIFFLYNNHMPKYLSPIPKVYSGSVCKFWCYLLVHKFYKKMDLAHTRNISLYIWDWILYAFHDVYRLHYWAALYHYTVWHIWLAGSGHHLSPGDDQQRCCLSGNWMGNSSGDYHYIYKQTNVCISFKKQIDILPSKNQALCKLNYCNNCLY